MKTVGIIGGLGPDTTAKFYIDIIRFFQKKFSEVRPSIVIASVPLSYAVEQKFIQENKGVENYIPLLIHEAQRLEKAEVDFLVMPCNSLHILIEDIRSSVNIPVLSIIEETVSFLKKNKFNTVGIISSLATVQYKLYETAFDEAQIIYKKPDDMQQKLLGEIIVNLLAGKKIESDRQKLQKIIDSFKLKNVDCVILACTDFQLLEPTQNLLPIFDTMQILAESTAKNQMQNILK